MLPDELRKEGDRFFHEGPVHEPCVDVIDQRDDPDKFTLEPRKLPETDIQSLTGSFQVAKLTFHRQSRRYKITLQG